MTLEKITLMEAYIIETLRNSNVTDSELLQVNESSINKWKVVHDTFDYTILQSLAKDEEAFKSIITSGYKIKFLTVNGLVNLLHLKFSKVPETDFDKTEQGIEHLRMTEEELTVLQDMLSSNWVIVPSENENEVSIKQAVHI